MIMFAFLWWGIDRIDNWDILLSLKSSLVAQMTKNSPAMQETWVWSRSQEDPLEKEMATQSSILVWRTLWTEEPGGFMGSESVRHDWATMQALSLKIKLTWKRRQVEIEEVNFEKVLYPSIFLLRCLESSWNSISGISTKRKYMVSLIAS